jgi:hypothetical protein
MAESDVMWGGPKSGIPCPMSTGCAADDEAVNELGAQELPNPEGEASGGAPRRPQQQ